MEEQQLLHACRILFGAELNLSRGFLDYLQLSGLKSAYRKRAWETHPDGGRRDLGLSEIDAAAFYEVRTAYVDLLNFLRRRDRAKGILDDKQAPSRAQSPPEQQQKSARTTHPSPESPFLIKINPIILAPAANDRTTTSIDRFHQGPLPDRPLLFGHFLYYSGLATWRTITRILIWQKRERPRFGELGNRFGMLSQEDINLILRHKKSGTPFGEVALALGLLDNMQRRALLLQQQRLQKKFGAILLEKQLIEEQQLRALLYRFRLHNQGAAPDTSIQP